MKILKFFLAIIFFGVMQISCMEDKAYKSCNCSKILYSLGTRFGRSDYLYLVNSNSVWFLKKKIELNKSIEDVDKYYLRLEFKVNGVAIPIYYTPLHEAIRRGNLESVKVLLAAGADLNKSIKQCDIEPEDMAVEDIRYVLCIESLAPTDFNDKYQEIIEKQRVGLSAIELAEALIKEEDFEVSLAQRKQIYRYLLSFK